MFIVCLIKMFNMIYFRKRDLEIKRGKNKLRRLKVDKILKTLEKNCHDKNKEITVIEKGWNFILVKLKGEKGELIFMYHNTDMVFNEQYIEFLRKVKIHGTGKWAYITTGVFEAVIHKNFNQNIYFRRGYLEDYKFFLMKQLGLRGTVSKLFKEKRLNFYRYLPR